MYSVEIVVGDASGISSRIGVGNEWSERDESATSNLGVGLAISIISVTSMVSVAGNACTRHFAIRP